MIGTRYPGAARALLISVHPALFLLTLSCLRLVDSALAPFSTPWFVALAAAFVACEFLDGVFREALISILEGDSHGPLAATYGVGTGADRVSNFASFLAILCSTLEGRIAFLATAASLMAVLVASSVSALRERRAGDE